MAEHHSAPQITSDPALNGHAGNSGKIRASHLLVKHKDSRRPSSWREVCSCHSVQLSLGAQLVEAGMVRHADGL